MCHVITLMYMIIYGKLYHIWYCIWGNACFVSMKKISIFELVLVNGFYGFIALFANFEDVLS